MDTQPTTVETTDLEQLRYAVAKEDIEVQALERMVQAHRIESAKLAKKGTRAGEAALHRARLEELQKKLSETRRGLYELKNTLEDKVTAAMQAAGLG